MQSATELEKLSREVFSQQIQCMLPNRSHHHYLQMYRNVVIKLKEADDISMHLKPLVNIINVRLSIITILLLFYG